MDPWVHIIGGGLSGLSLAASLAQFKELPGHVLISEPKPRSLAAKTFSFGTQTASERSLDRSIRVVVGRSVAVIIMCLITGLALNMGPGRENMF